MVLCHFYSDESVFSRQCFSNTLDINNPRLFLTALLPGTRTHLSVVLLFLLELNHPSKNLPLFLVSLLLLISTLFPTLKVKEVNRGGNMVGWEISLPFSPGRATVFSPGFCLLLECFKLIPLKGM